MLALRTGSGGDLQGSAAGSGHRTIPAKTFDFDSALQEVRSERCFYKSLSLMVVEFFVAIK